MNRLYLLSLSLAVVMLAACGRDDDAPAQAQEAAPDRLQTLYRHVPADTAMLFGNTAPIPAELQDAWWAQAESLAPFYSHMAEEMRGRADMDPDSAQAAAAFMDLVTRLIDREQFVAMGFRTDALSVMYLDGLLPYLRMELGDATRLETTLDEIAMELGMEWRRDSVDGQPYRWLPLDENEATQTLAITVMDEHFAAGWIPRNDDALRHLTGQAPPPRAISLGDFERFNRDNGYLAYGSGYVDLVRLSDILLDPDDAQAADARATLGLDTLAAHPACRSELPALIAHFPRVSYGVTELNVRRASLRGKFETSTALGRQLVGVADAPLELGTDPGGAFNFGVAFNLVNLRNLFRGYVDSWVEQPPECPAFSTVRENAEDWQVNLNRPIPPVATSIHGLQAVLTDYDMSGGEWNARGTLALYMRNPQMLLGMAQMFSPELAALNLQPGGAPQPLPEGLVPNLPEGLQIFIAMSESALGVAAGEESLGRLNTALRPQSADGTVMSYGVDFSRYADLMEDVIGQAGLDEDAEDNSQAEAMQQLFHAMKEFYDRGFGTVRLTENGIVVDSTSDLK